MKSQLRRVALIIDPQNMFMPIPGMPLSVQGADKDMQRLASYIENMLNWYDAIVVTLDTHPADHIAHPIRWQNKNREIPDPFTVITSAEYENGDWLAMNAPDAAWQGEYLKRLEATGRVHTIWPPHGNKDDIQYEVFRPLKQALRKWEHASGKWVQYVAKGMHRDTEQFGVFAADVPIDGALETHVNMELIDYINSAKEIDVFGEASSHCAMDSVNQLLANIPQADWGKISVFRDTMSPVAAVTHPTTGEVIVDFPALAEKWFSELETKGVRVTKVAA